MKKPLVVGYRGEIGSYILQCLIKHMSKALDILCFDNVEEEHERLERIAASDVIFLCIPLDETLDWLEHYKEKLVGKIIVEQTSLKNILHSDDRFKELSKNIHILSMHILFRPSATPDKKDHWIALIGDNWDQGNNLGILGFIIHNLSSHIIFYLSWKEHDQAMAVNQALVHRVLLVLGSCLDDVNASTYISTRVRELSKRIANGDPDLYESIQQNPFLEASLLKFKERLNEFQISNYMLKKD